MAPAIEVVTAPAPVPDKYDIIPIHTSDVASFKRCRRYWDWTSPTRDNLRRRVTINGVNIPLWFGTGIHYALEMYYDPILRRDPVEAFLTWYQYQIDGGIVGEEWLERTYDIHPQLLQTTGKLPSDVVDPDNTWVIQGLRQLVPNWEVVQDEFEAHRELGIGMLTFYKDWAERNDDFVVVAAESTYSVPLGFEAIDQRQASPNYGKKLEVHARGKRDAVVYWPSEDRFGINDYKTAVRIDETYRAKLEKDEQCSNYLWATKMEALMYESMPWYGKPVDRVLYTMLKKNFPHDPTVLQSGLLSIDRQNEGTTPELFQKAIVGNEILEHWFQTNPKAQAYYTYLCEQGDDQFILREPVTRNAHEIKNTGDHLRMIAEEMVNSPAIYPNPTGEFRCVQCAFRAPCIAADDGSDWQGMLADGYEVNRDR